MPAVLRLRYEVLDKTVGLPEKTEVSNMDKNPATIHMAAFDSGTVVSTVRFDQYPDEETYLVRRMATQPDRQGEGIGTVVFRAAEQLAIKNGARKVMLHARLGAVSFYEHLGYTLTGAVAVHDGDENPEMIKEIK